LLENLGFLNVLSSEGDKMIKINGLTKYYKKEIGCKDISLNIKAGDFVGFIGPNGSGKTTLIRTMLGLLNPSKGDVSILGKDLKDSKFYDIFDETSYISNETTFFKKLKVKELLKHFKNLKDVNEDYLNHLIKSFKLELDKSIEKLSFGNQKKLNIIIALMSQPKLLIMDEPTNGLDPIVQKILFKELKKLNKDGATIFLSSHIISDIEKVCNRIMFIKEGEIILDSNIETLKSSINKKIIYTNRKINLKDLELLEQTKIHYKYIYSGSLDILFKHLIDEKIFDINISDMSLSDLMERYYD